MPLPFRLVTLFALGAAVGSFLNVCIYRLPLEKSILWPSSRCGRCYQPVHWYDNIPLLSYWLLRGRCRSCGAHFSARYFLIELLTALGFVGLYDVEVVRNVQGYDAALLGPVEFQIAAHCTFAFHTLLFCFLLVATFCDIDHRIIPLPLTITGTALGLVGAVLWPWPWPYTPAQAAMPANIPWWFVGRVRPVEGLYDWPFWGPLPGWAEPGGNWQTGLATGLAGLLAGTLIMRGVRFSFGVGMGSEYMEDPLPAEATFGSARRWWSWLGRVGGKTMGLGDADLMMMAGAFLGWQPVVVSFFVAVFPGLVLGLGQLIRRGENALPFGPALAIGVLLTALYWHKLGAPFQPFFFNGPLLAFIVGLSAVFMVIAGYVIRLLRLRRAE